MRKMVFALALVLLSGTYALAHRHQAFVKWQTADGGYDVPVWPPLYPSLICKWLGFGVNEHEWEACGYAASARAGVDPYNINPHGRVLHFLPISTSLSKQDVKKIAHDEADRVIAAVDAAARRHVPAQLQNRGQNPENHRYHPRLESVVEGDVRLLRAYWWIPLAIIVLLLSILSGCFHLIGCLCSARKKHRSMDVQGGFYTGGIREADLAIREARARERRMAEKT